MMNALMLPVKCCKETVVWLVLVEDPYWFWGCHGYIFHLHVVWHRHSVIHMNVFLTPVKTAPLTFNLSSPLTTFLMTTISPGCPTIWTHCSNDFLFCLLYKYRLENVCCLVGSSRKRTHIGFEVVRVILTLLWKINFQ